MMAWVLSLALMIAAGILSLEVWGSLPALSRRVIWLVTLCLPRERRALRRREFREELNGHYTERRVAGLTWTLRLAPVCMWEGATSTSLQPSRRVLGWLAVLAAAAYIVIFDEPLLSRNYQTGVVMAGLVYIYVRHHRNFSFLRTAFAVLLVLGAGLDFVDSVIYPFAHPFLVQSSMQTAFALLIAWPMARLVRTRLICVLWFVYPFVVSMLALISTASSVQAMLAVMAGSALSAIALQISHRIHLPRPHA